MIDAIYQWLAHQVAHNEMFAGFVAFGLVATAPFYLKWFAGAAHRVFLRHFTVHLVIVSTDEAFGWVSDWVNTTGYINRMRRMRIVNAIGGRAAQESEHRGARRSTGRLRSGPAGTCSSTMARWWFSSARSTRRPARASRSSRLFRFGWSAAAGGACWRSSRRRASARRRRRITPRSRPGCSTIGMSSAPGRRGHAPQRDEDGAVDWCARRMVVERERAPGTLMHDLRGRLLLRVRGSGLHPALRR